MGRGTHIQTIGMDGSARMYLQIGQDFGTMGIAKSQVAATAVEFGKLKKVPGLKNRNGSRKILLFSV